MGLMRILRSYLPTLIPVEVSETTAKWWFRSLLSAVDFLHRRGIVHNDIKYVSYTFFARALLILYTLLGLQIYY